MGGDNVQSRNECVADLERPAPRRRAGTGATTSGQMGVDLNAWPAGGRGAQRGTGMDTQWRLRMLGAFALERDGVAVAAFAHRRQDVLLAYLALKPGQAHPRAPTAATLWPGRTRRQALNRMTEVQTHLNRQLAEADVRIALLASGRQTIQLNPLIQTDVREFEDLIAAALHEPNEQRRQVMLEQALERYGAGLLPVLDEPWVVAERARLQRVHDYAAQQLVQLAGGPSGQGRMEGAAAMAPSDLARYLSRGRQLVEAMPEGVGSVGAGRTVTRVAEPQVDEAFGFPAPPSDREVAEQGVALVERAEPELRGPDRQIWLDRLDTKRENLYRSIEWAIEREHAEIALRLTGALWRYWYSRQRIGEGRRYVEQALTLSPRPDGRWYAKAAHGAGALALHDGDLRAARRRFEAALPIWRTLEDVEAIGRVLDDLGLIAYKEGDFERARGRYEESLAVLRQLKDPGLRVTVLRNAAKNAQAMGQPAQAEAFLRERLDIGRQLGDSDVIGWTLLGLVGFIRARDGSGAAQAALA